MAATAWAIWRQRSERQRIQDVFGTKHLNQRMREHQTVQRIMIHAMRKKSIIMPRRIVPKRTANSFGPAARSLREKGRLTGRGCPAFAREPEQPGHSRSAAKRMLQGAPGGGLDGRRPAANRPGPDEPAAARVLWSTGRGICNSEVSSRRVTEERIGRHVAIQAQEPGGAGDPISARVAVEVGAADDRVHRLATAQRPPVGSRR